MSNSNFQKLPQYSPKKNMDRFMTTTFCFWYKLLSYFSFDDYHKYHDYTQCSRKGFFGLYIIIWEKSGQKLKQELMQKRWRNIIYGLALHSLFSFFSYKTQYHWPRRGFVHNGPNHLTWIINQENASQTWPKDNLMETVPQPRFHLLRWLQFTGIM